MAGAIFAVPFVTGLGPDLSALGEAGLYYTDANGERAGGFACIGHVPYPIPPHTCLVRIWASEDRIAEMASGEDFLFMEMIEEPVPEAPAAPMLSDELIAEAQQIFDATLRPAFEEEGIALVEPTAVRKADPPIFEDVLRKAGDSFSDLVTGLRQYGFEPGLRDTEDMPRLYGSYERWRQKTIKAQARAAVRKADPPVVPVTPDPKDKPEEKPPKPKPEKPDKAKVKTWLKAKGHGAANVDAAVDTAADATTGVMALHQVTSDQYKAGKQ